MDFITPLPLPNGKTAELHQEFTGHALGSDLECQVKWCKKAVMHRLWIDGSNLQTLACDDHYPQLGEALIKEYIKEGQIHG